ncbi:MAG: DUF4080 domain-containing protein [Clostridia bacterium]|nr:DUF4080 domain-containing protein [Clostridia bacterium]
MKILLFTLNASYAHAALSVRVLADSLRAASFDCEVVEATPTERRHALLARLSGSDATLFGFSVYIWNLQEILALAADLATLRPDAKIVFGGPEVSFDTDRFTALPFVDTVVVGEGEEAIVALAELVAADKPLPRLFEGRPCRDFLQTGIHYRADEAPARLVYYESARGCPFSCAFCLSSATEGVRAKSAEQTLADLAAFEKIAGPVTVKLVDRTFNFDRERAKAIWCGLLDSGYTKCYHFEVAAHLLDDESIAILSRFPKGKVRLEIGLQSTNAATLAAVARHTDATAVVDIAKRLTAAGNLHIHLDLIAGLPHEDYASFARSFDAAYFACDVLQLGFLKLLCGTALRRDAEALGLRYGINPPYEVLSTPVLSFAELARLHGISDLMERLRDSGRFPHTLHLLLPHYFSPFAFYEAFADYLTQHTGRALQKISQRDLFSRLADFGRATLPPDAAALLRERLRADYAMSETRKPPRELLD